MCIKTCSMSDNWIQSPNCQKAPSAKRCIKTVDLHALEPEIVHRQKATSAKRCIKTLVFLHAIRHRLDQSESTERQKVH